jgi:hypothetical protein
MKTLKRRFTVALLLPAMFVGALAAQELGKQPFSITISTLKSSYTAGTAVELRVVMTNTSDHEVKAGAVYDGSIDASYQYDVRDSKGEPAPVKPAKEFHRATVIMRTLKPSESVEDRTNVGRWVDFREPGEYTVQVSRFIGDDEKEGAVKSNTITITIVEPPPTAAAPR